MSLSNTQLKAVEQATRVLASAGLNLSDLVNAESLDPETHAPTHDGSQVCYPSSTICSSLYEPPRAKVFSPDEKASRTSGCRLNRQTLVDGIINHPLGVIVEYPETGASPGECIAHCFAVDPFNYTSPKANFQYSLGDSHGGRNDAHCFLLKQANGKSVPCSHLRTSCKGLKICSFCPHIGEKNHSYTTRSQLPPPASANIHSSGAGEEIFLKTLAFFSVLLERGCSFQMETDGSEVCGDVAEGFDSDNEDDSDTYRDETADSLFGSRPRRPSRDLNCKGSIVLRGNRFGRSFVQCEKYSNIQRGHLILRNLDEYNIPYLAALLAKNQCDIATHEQDAWQKGYGPLMPCNFVASPSEKKSYCPNWHRTPDGELRRGVLRRWSPTGIQCSTVFDFYIPHNLHTCPQVVVVSRNPHSHPPPLPVKTPPILVSVFNSLLRILDWKLADATPRRIVLDSAFIAGLRKHLGWTGIRDPVLSDLHPSLGNADHVRRYINKLREEYFPDGTGLAGAIRLMKEHSKMPHEEQYVRHVETYHNRGEDDFSLVVCMLPAMSQKLMSAKRLSIDTSFKRLHGWEEFEIETWDSDTKRSVVGARAFTTSQSGQAHFELFKIIFDIASCDTGLAVCFKHIHGYGFEAWIADAHKGQGLGVGMYCRWLCRDLTGNCQREPHRSLQSLDPYEHLKRFYRICVTHYKRNIHEMRGNISSDVRAAMLSLASSEPHPDLDGTFALIKRGGRKASAWLKDKLEGNKFAFPALYQPASLIPLDIWKGMTLSTNSGEQQHRNVYRDGVNLTMLAGIIRGMQYDWRAMVSIDLYRTTGIQSRDQPATYAFRIGRSVARHALAQRRVLEKEETKTFTLTGPRLLLNQREKLQHATVRNVPVPSTYDSHTILLGHGENIQSSRVNDSASSEPQYSDVAYAAPVAFSVPQVPHQSSAIARPSVDYRYGSWEVNAESGLGEASSQGHNYTFPPESYQLYYRGFTK